MAAGFLTKALSTLLSSAARWVEFSDGSQSPVHGAVIIDPSTGLVVPTGQTVTVDAQTLIALFTATAAADTNRLPVTEPDGYQVSGSITSAAGNVSIDLRGYGGVSVHITSAGGGYMQAQTSDDNTNWTNVTGFLASATGTTALGQGMFTTGVYTFPKIGRYFRVNGTNWSSGTWAILITAHKNAMPNQVGAVVSGGAAHDAAVYLNPTRIGGRARTSNYTAVANDDTTDLVTTTAGALVTRPYSIPQAQWKYAAGASGIVNTTTAVTLNAAGAAGLRNYITGFQLQHATLSGATELVIRDGGAGTVIWRTQLQTTALPLTNIELPEPIFGTAATLIEAATLTAVTGGIYLNVQGHQEP